MSISYQRNFTIGLRETQEFYLTLELGRWRGGIAGFGVAGALVALLYTGQAALTTPLRALAVLGGGAAAMLAAVLVLTLSICGRVRGQIRRSGREHYVQQTQIDGFGVHVTVDKGQARLGFDKLVRVRETRRAFYLFLSDNQAWILPKAQMEDRAGECRQLRELFRTVVERGRLRLKK